MGAVLMRGDGGERPRAARLSAGGSWAAGEKKESGPLRWAGLGGGASWAAVRWATSCISLGHGGVLGRTREERTGREVC